MPKTTQEQIIQALTDIVNHLDGDQPLYPGALIFEEDAPAIDVLKRLLRKAKAEQSTCACGAQLYGLIRVHHCDTPTQPLTSQSDPDEYSRRVKAGMGVYYGR